MGVAMTSFHDPDKLFHTEKGDDATEHSKPNRHIMRVMSPIPTMAVTMMLLMAMPMSSIVPTTSLGHDGVRNKMEEGVPEQSTTGKREQNLEQPLLLLAVVQGDEEEDEERSGRDEERCHDRVEPD